MTWLENIDADKETSLLLRSIFQHLTDAILVLDQDGFVITANPAAEQLTEWSSQEMAGKIHFCQICRGVATCTAEATCMDCFTKKMMAPSFEMKVLTKSGKEFPVAASSTQLPHRSSTALVVVLRDMSEQQKAERERNLLLMTNYVIQAQEEERKRISRELHDGVGQALYSILVGLNVINQVKMDEQMSNHLATVQQMTARALEEVKSLAVELRPSALDDLGLVPAIRSYMKRFEQIFGIEVELDSKGTRRRYAPVVETTLYRICQEAMTNAAKYADTDKLTVSIHDSGDKIAMCVADQGKGFRLDQVEASGTGLGLYGMQERASLLGGQLTITSELEKGTMILVSIPLDEKGEPIHVDPRTNR
ncbi:ATP-binding protein [Brevibacillus fluminis]|uniref:sensor histidine kinase n=1 Tax=Brevibacillus fluminis TaxID=511487 RepID=UPI003F88A7EF